MSASGSESAFGPMRSANARYLSPMTEPHVRDLPARTYVGERSTVAMDEFAATIDAGFRRLFGRAGEPLGPPFIRYYAFEPELGIELGVPSAAGEAELPA